MGFAYLFIGLFDWALALLALLQVVVPGLARGPEYTALLMAAGCLMFLLLIVAHELGHHFAGLAVGIRSCVIALTFVKLVRLRGRWRVSRNNDWLHPAGYVASEITPHHSTWRWGLAVFAGPAVNLVLSIVCLVSAAVVHTGPPEGMGDPSGAGWRQLALLLPGTPAVAALNLAGLISLWLGAGSLVPAGGKGGNRNDGDLLLALWCGKPHPVFDDDDDAQW